MLSPVSPSGIGNTFRLLISSACIFKLLVPRLLKANLYRVLLESQAANLAATMNAMDAASKNAGELVNALGVTLNKVRQAGITNEILDIVNGAEALNN